MPDNRLSKDEKMVFGCIMFLIAIVLCLVLAVVGTGLYLALHNWG
jgi:hypothetical protein